MSDPELCVPSILNSLTARHFQNAEPPFDEITNEDLVMPRLWRCKNIPVSSPGFRRSPGYS
jgi:hypothetical protein